MSVSISECACAVGGAGAAMLCVPEKSCTARSSRRTRPEGRFPD